jgi:hypothetical protein
MFCDVNVCLFVEMASISGSSRSPMKLSAKSTNVVSSDPLDANSLSFKTVLSSQTQSVR